MLIFQKPDLEAECLCWQGLSFYNYLEKCCWRRPFLKKAQFLKESNFSMLFKFCLMKWFLPTFKSKSSQNKVFIPSSRVSSQPRDWTHVSYVSCIGRQVLYH